MNCAPNLIVLEVERIDLDPMPKNIKNSGSFRKHVLGVDIVYSFL